MANTKSVLIIGGNGFVGNQLALTLRDHFKVFATFCKNPFFIPGVTFLPANIDSRNWLKRIAYMTRPDVVIYVAGKNDRRWADHHEYQTELLHSVGPANTFMATDILQPKLIFVSNSYVFDGMKGNYHENDTVLPSTIIGKMKLSGENIVKSKSLNYVILRSSPVFGIGNAAHPSFLDRLRIHLSHQRRFEASHLEVQSFAPIEGLCETIKQLVGSGLKNRIFHYGGLTKLSVFEFAVRFAKRFGYDPNLIIPKGIIIKKSGVSDDFVYDFSLNSSQTIETLKIKPLLLEEGFDLIQKKLIPHS